MTMPPVSQGDPVRTRPRTSGFWFPAGPDSHIEARSLRLLIPARRDDTDDQPRSSAPDKVLRPASRGPGNAARSRPSESAASERASTVASSPSAPPIRKQTGRLEASHGSGGRRQRLAVGRGAAGVEGDCECARRQRAKQRLALAAAALGSGAACFGDLGERQRRPQALGVAGEQRGFGPVARRAADRDHPKHGTRSMGQPAAPVPCGSSSFCTPHALSA